MDQLYGWTWVGSSVCGHCCPRLKDSFKHSVSGTHALPRPPDSRPLWQTPEAAVWGQHPSGTVAVGHKAPAPLFLQSQWAIYSWSMLPFCGHHWGKATGNGWKKTSLVIMNGIFLWKWLQNTFFFLFLKIQQPHLLTDNSLLTQANKIKTRGGRVSWQLETSQAGPTLQVCMSLRRHFSGVTQSTISCFTAAWR